MVNPIPDEYPRVIPYLLVDDANAAIDFYVEVLGATERMRMPGEEPEKIGHAELEIGDSMIMLADESPEMNLRGPKLIGGSPVTICVYVTDTDATCERAAAAGATTLSPPETQFYGDRSAIFEDPFGHVWNLMTHVEDVEPDEMERRMAERTG